MKIIMMKNNIWNLKIFYVNLHCKTSRGGAVVARWAHNPKVAGSSPAPATRRRVPRGCAFHFGEMISLFTNPDSSLKPIL